MKLTIILDLKFEFWKYDWKFWLNFLLKFVTKSMGALDLDTIYIQIWLCMGSISPEQSMRYDFVWLV